MTAPRPANTDTAATPPPTVEQHAQQMYDPAGTWGGASDTNPVTSSTRTTTATRPASPPSRHQAQDLDDAPPEQQQDEPHLAEEMTWEQAQEIADAACEIRRSPSSPRAVVMPTIGHDVLTAPLADVAAALLCTVTAQ